MSCYVGEDSLYISWKSAQSLANKNGGSEVNYQKHQIFIRISTDGSTLMLLNIKHYQLPRINCVEILLQQGQTFHGNVLKNG